MDMKKLLIVLASALVLTACGSYHIGTGSGPSPSTNPGLGFAVAVSEKDHAATLHVGQKLEVVLHANNGMNNWTQPKSSDASILAAVVNPAATAVRGVTLAAFQALAPGSAQITATAGADCSPGQPCPQYLMVLTITVTVVAP